MQTIKPFIPKDIEALPDAYTITIHYVDSKSETFEIAHHVLGEKVFEFVTHSDDRWSWVQMTSVKRIEFDKRFSQIVALKVKNEKANRAA